MLVKPVSLTYSTLLLSVSPGAIKSRIVKRRSGPATIPAIRSGRTNAPPEPPAEVIAERGIPTRRLPRNELLTPSISLSLATRSPIDISCSSSRLSGPFNSFCSASCKRDCKAPCSNSSLSTLSRVSACISPEALICLLVSSAADLI